MEVMDGSQEVFSGHVPGEIRYGFFTIPHTSYNESDFYFLQIGMIKIADTSWLTDYPVNPMNIGQIVNNANDEYSANVHYQELDVPNTFPLLLRKFLPNIKYESSGIDNELRIVYLQV